YLRF
uniref:FMRFamide-like neuropeptide YLRF-amide n=1 Tax=Hirudo medicinalis TaxID=6421 RepID=FAR3_HIRME